MLKRLFSGLVMLCLLGSMIPVNILVEATVINEDVTCSTPISSPMETIEEVNAINAQLTTSEGSSVLSEDKKDGRYSVQVTAKDNLSNGYLEYTLVHSEPFSIENNSELQLWVKAGSGASWISFYSNGSLITSDANEDGKFEVGTDVQSGVWTSIKLDLSQTSTPLLQADDLIVRTDEKSVWFFDDVKSLMTSSINVNLENMQKDNVILNNGHIEFKKTNDMKAFQTEPTVLATGGSRLVYEKIITTEDEFNAGTFENGVILNKGGSITFINNDLCSLGTSISSEYYSSNYASKAFDDSIGSFWLSAHKYSSVMNNAYIGYDFGSPKQIIGFKISQGAVSSFKLQYYDTITSTWETNQIFEAVYDDEYMYTVNGLTSASKWRLLANSTSSRDRWYVYDLEFFDGKDNYNNYVSPDIDISTIKKVEYGEISYTDSAQTKLKIETALSLDGGINWGDWCSLLENGCIVGINEDTDLQNARLRYRVSVSDVADGIDPCLYNIGIKLVSGNKNSVQLSGTLSKVKIELDNNNINGYEQVNDKYFFSDMKSSYFEDWSISGDGNTIYYENPRDKNNLYRLDLYTGASEKITNQSTAEDILDLKVNYDGTSVYWTNSWVSDGNYAKLHKYDNTAVNKSSYLEEIAFFDFGYDGSVMRCEKTIGGKYQIFKYSDSNGTEVNVTKEFSSAKEISSAFEGKCFYAVINNCIYKIEFVEGKLKFKFTSKFSGNATNVISSRSGEAAYFTKDSGLYVYNDNTGSVQKLLDNISTLYQIIDGDKLVCKDAEDTIFIYDPATGIKENIVLEDYTDKGFSMDYSGNKMAYVSDKGCLRVWDRSGKIDKNSYLLSFDGKNSWYSYRGGSWNIVENGFEPSKETLVKHGMTLEELNSLSAEDFSKLYANGSEIYSVDIAVYFASMSRYNTPSIQSITIKSEEQNRTDGTEHSLYTAKKEDFSGTKWNKINKIYPIEISPNESSFVYFICKNGKYSYYDGTGWCVETGTEIADLIADTKTNWIELNLIGMTTGELRAIPQTALTSYLAGEDFSVVYCMQVTDKSTTNYHSNISVDCSKDYFTSTNLTLTINYIDGTSQVFSNLTDVQVEEFMTWMNKNHSPKNSMFYTIVSGNTSYFINHKLIHSVSVIQN